MLKEYPKVISAGGIKVTVTSADDEARWVSADAPKPVAPVDDAPVTYPVQVPEADVEVIHDDTEDVSETPKAKKGGKKK